MEAVGLLPTGKLLPLDGSPYDIREFTSLEGLKLDDVYWGMVPGKPAVYECRDRGIRVTLEASEIFTHAVVYTPPGRPYFCIENQTCSTDAHNLHAQGLEKEAHLQVLQLGKSARGTVRVRVSRI
jgi:aldose 1-epimerase